MIDGVGVRLGPLCDRLLKPHAGSLAGLGSTATAATAPPSTICATHLARDLVRHGADVVTVSRQMGHARPSITLVVY